MVDALALDADEGRGKLRKATGSRKQVLIRRYPNGGTPMVKNHRSCTESIGTGRELGELKHLSTRRKRNQPRFRE